MTKLFDALLHPLQQLFSFWVVGGAHGRLLQIN